MGVLVRQTSQARADDAERDVFVPIPHDFRTEAGDRLEDRSFRLRWHGRVAGPTVVVAGGVSSGRRVADTDGSGWWSSMVCPGGGVDLERFSVLGFDFAPGRAERPITLTTADQARLLALGLDALGVERLHAFVGASYGGMVALAFAERFPERIDRLGVISAAHRADPMATAIRGVQRRLLRFAIDAGRAEEGVSLARQLAMTTYRSAEEFRARFDNAPAPERAGGPYGVCDYLVSRGRAYPQVMRPHRWIALSDSMDRHRVEPQRIAARTTVVAVPSDRLVPIEDLRELAAAIPAARLVETPSLYGHDAFLKEVGALTPVLRSLLEEEAP